MYRVSGPGAVLVVNIQVARDTVAEMGRVHLCWHGWAKALNRGKSKFPVVSSIIFCVFKCARVSAT